MARGTGIYVDASKATAQCKAFEPALRKALMAALKKFRTDVVDRTPVGDPSYDPHPGLAKRSWSNVRKQGTGYAFDNPQSYTVTLEEGLYKHDGPRTVQMSDGIYSTQAPGGMMQPLLDDDSYIGAMCDDILNTVVREVSR